MEDDYYKRGLTLFGSEDKLYSIEKAQHSISSSQPIVGLRCENGVVFVSLSWKNVSPLIDKDNIEKVFLISEKVGMTAAGNLADSQKLADELRDVALEDISKYSDVEDIKHIVKKVSTNVRDKTQEITRRPYGVCMLVGGVDKGTGSTLYRVEPDGTVTSWFATSVGLRDKQMNKYLEKNYEDDINVEDGVELGIEALLKEHDVGVENLEVVKITDEDEFTRVGNEKVEQIINNSEVVNKGDN